MAKTVKGKTRARKAPAKRATPARKPAAKAAEVVVAEELAELTTRVIAMERALRDGFAGVQLALEKPIRAPERAAPAPAKAPARGKGRSAPVKAGARQTRVKARTKTPARARMPEPSEEQLDEFFGDEHALVSADASDGWVRVHFREKPYKGFRDYLKGFTSECPRWGYRAALDPDDPETEDIGPRGCWYANLARGADFDALLASAHEIADAYDHEQHAS